MSTAARAKRRRRAAAVVALSALLGVVETARAQTWLYTGTDYGTGANWSTGITPGPGQTATFNASGANQPIVGSNFTIGTVDLSAGSLTINAMRTLTLQSAFNLTDASLLGDGALSLGAGSLLTAAGTSAVVVAPVISGTGATLITGADVTFTGPTPTPAQPRSTPAAFSNSAAVARPVPSAPVPSRTTAACFLTARTRTPSPTSSRARVP